MNKRLTQLLRENLITPLAYQFAQFIAEQDGQDEDSIVAFSAALLSELNQKGDVCINLQQHASQHCFNSLSDNDKAPALNEWRKALLASECVALPGETAPMLLDEDRLYLYRFWRYEQQVQQGILQRLPMSPEIDAQSLQTGLQDFFPAQEKQAVDWQMLASAMAATSRFCVISGGPGTGKTTTLIKVLALLLQQNKRLRIKLAAPTGKAAARMLESIRARQNELQLADRIRALLPDESFTLHRLLGYNGKKFTYHVDNPLLLDCVVIDEASMMDLPMTARLFQALPQHAQVILLGDRDQLASVEAGSVLGDITGHGRAIVYQPESANRLSKLTRIKTDDLPQDPKSPPIANSIALLKTSHRFSRDSMIGKLARAINQGDGEQALELLQSHQNPTNLWIESPEQRVDARAIQWAARRYQAYLECEQVADALQQFSRARVLCAVREGPFGVKQLNKLILAALHSAGFIQSQTLHYHGQAILMARNDYESGLYNGDIGLVWRTQPDTLKACFPEASGSVRCLPLHDLPEHENAWAMTVHKSQGSEFDDVLMILPPNAQNRLSRELLYTGVTRARKHITLHARHQTLVAACALQTQRESGLSERLGWD
ncbi:MAG: exodeoxyribonuclease V subunit alpha [gamma proteobacterium symbiont of Bathyaustriella thionipta]|nr:exodeoxyribonuclease V subunit alpha [gamma proteobacterium symbiont of Bathyaustriella thionipta]